MRSRVFCGDCIEVMRDLEGCSVDAIVTDPPYGLGFMGKAWDELPPGVEWARECLRVLKPGGHLLAFGGSRTYHRLACAVEDAGFEVRDQIMWLYGSGFPKSHNLKGEREGWGTALKPAHEPILLARRPLTGTVAENVLAHGTGALNIDGCRIEGDVPSVPQPRFSRDMRAGFGASEGRIAQFSSATGRWPANVVLDEEAGRLLDEQSGERPSGGRAAGEYGGIGTGAIYGDGDKTTLSALEANTGGASRFFYCAKASKGERNAGLDALPDKVRRRVNSGGLENDPRWAPVIAKNNHPTVKPISLMRYLVRLVTPPGGVILDPFLGSGTTGCAAALEGFEFVGIEREPEYVKIAEARIAHWSAQPVQMELGDAA